MKDPSLCEPNVPRSSTRSESKARRRCFFSPRHRRGGAAAFPFHGYIDGKKKRILAKYFIQTERKQQIVFCTEGPKPPDCISYGRTQNSRLYFVRKGSKASKYPKRTDCMAKTSDCISHLISRLYFVRKAPKPQIVFRTEPFSRQTLFLYGTEPTPLTYADYSVARKTCSGYHIDVLSGNMLATLFKPKLRTALRSLLIFDI